MSKNSTVKRPKFKNEAEEADWYHTPEGHAYSIQTLKKAAREGKIRVHNKPSAAELQKLLDEARAQLLRPVSIRLSEADLDAAKRLAAKTGKGYQTILKEIIHEGLKHAS